MATLWLALWGGLIHKSQVNINYTVTAAQTDDAVPAVVCPEVIFGAEEVDGKLSDVVW